MEPVVTDRAEQERSGRAIQMAKRSNACAGDTIELKRLNWLFIRDARVSLNDAEGVEQADAAIRSLQ